jgi:hypothetical protein
VIIGGIGRLTAYFGLRTTDALPIWEFLDELPVLKLDSCEVGRLVCSIRPGRSRLPLKIDRPTVPHSSRAGLPGRSDLLMSQIP